MGPLQHQENQHVAVQLVCCPHKTMVVEVLVGQSVVPTVSYLMVWSSIQYRPLLYWNAEERKVRGHSQ